MSKMYKGELKLDGKDLNIVAINYQKEENQETVETKSIDIMHHIHVLDRSYSMIGDIDKLIDNVISTFDCMKPTDLISVIWFASHDQCKVLFKGASLATKDFIIQKLNSIRDCVGCTCFSEPLKQVSEIINDFELLGHDFNVTFFTDGCTVTPWSSKEEEERIMNILENSLNNKILALNTIGYGNYYDEELLKAMSIFSTFGRFTHSRYIEDYSTIFKHDYEIIKNVVVDRVNIEAGEECEVLYLTNKSSKLSPRFINLNFLDKTKNQFFVVLPKDKDSFTLNGETIYLSDIKNKISKPTITNFLYAFAKELYYQGYQHGALDALLQTGDKYLIDKLLSAFTRDEKSILMEELSKAVIGRKHRKLDGEVDSSYIPEPNAYNIIDFLSELTQVDCQYIPVENYNRIGKKVVDSFNLFKKDKSKLPMSDMKELVFNDKKLNVSIRYIIEGTVSINPRQASKVGLENEYRTKMYRMQTIIKDGTLNIPSIQVRISEGELEKLSYEATKVFANSDYNREGNYYVIDLSELPVTNRYYSSLSIEDILIRTKALLINKVMQKVINSLLADRKTEKFSYYESGTVKKDFIPEQIEVLKEHGLNSKLEYVGVDNKVVKDENGDFYEAKSIEFAIKGCSSIPKIADSLAKRENGKKMNIMDEIICNTIDMMGDYNESQLKLEQALIKRSINQLSTELFASKISKILTGGWWKGLTIAPKHEEFTMDDTTLLVKTKREKVFL